MPNVTVTTISRGSWYNYFHINLLLKATSDNEQNYLVSDPATNDPLQLTQTINHALHRLLELGHKTIVVPINLGNVFDHSWNGVHWSGIVIFHEQSDDGVDRYHVSYADSLAWDMNKEIPNLRHVLAGHGISEIKIAISTQQQLNNYDCGPYTVINLDSIARTGNAPPTVSSDTIITQRNLLNDLLSRSEEGAILSETEVCETYRIISNSEQDHELHPLPIKRVQQTSDVEFSKILAQAIKDTNSGIRTSETKYFPAKTRCAGSKSFGRSDYDIDSIEHSSIILEEDGSFPKKTSSWKFWQRKSPALERTVGDNAQGVVELVAEYDTDLLGDDGCCCW